MKASETIRLLQCLKDIESSIARLYRLLSKRENFSRQGKSFWKNMALEESGHVRILSDLTRKALEDPSFEMDVRMDENHLREFAKDIKGLARGVRKKGISEPEAYALGARLEVELMDVGFTENIYVNDQRVASQIWALAADTREHRLIMNSYAMLHVPRRRAAVEGGAPAGAEKSGRPAPGSPGLFLHL